MHFHAFFRSIFWLIALIAIQANGQTTKPVQAYSTNGQLQWPLTFLSTNVFGLSNVSLLFTNGQMWISVPAASSGDAGGTNSRQFGSASLTNLSGNPNVATNILGAGTVTVTSNNLGEWTITGTGGGDAGGTNSRQGGSLVLTNLSSNPYTGYTNLLFQVADNNVLSNLQTMAGFYWTNAQASAMLLSNLVNNPNTGYTNLQLQVAANNALSNLQTMASFYWTNAQASSMTLSNLASSSISFSTANVISNVGNTKYLVQVPAITASNLVLSFATNRFACHGLTNVVLTNIIEGTHAVDSGDMSIFIQNTNGVSCALVWPAYGAQHGYYFRTNKNSPVLAWAAVTNGKSAVVSLTYFGTNVFASIAEFP